MGGTPGTPRKVLFYARITHFMSQVAVMTLTVYQVSWLVKIAERASLLALQAAREGLYRLAADAMAIATIAIVMVADDDDDDDDDASDA